MAKEILKENEAKYIDPRRKVFMGIDMSKVKPPENTCTVDEIEKKYGIERTKIYKAIKKDGTLNGIKQCLFINEKYYMIRKWHVEKDELFEKFISEKGNIEQNTEHKI